MKRLTAILFTCIFAFPAIADSCWNHNGSVMRLSASGNDRWFSYEQPRQALYNSGVYQGTLLFNGRKNGNWYAGRARVFSSACPGNPLEYWVEGPVLQNPLRVQVEGTREVHRNCQPTGAMTHDVLVFTYMYNC
jgi:hypothetical protein